EEPVRSGAVRAVATLHPAEELALEEGRVRERDHHQVDDHERLDQRDPPRLGHRLFTRTFCARPGTCSRAARATPGVSSAFTRARSSREVPFELTTTASPSAIRRFSASTGASSISAGGRWNWSSGTRSTAGPENSERYATRWSGPRGFASGAVANWPAATTPSPRRGRGSDARSPISP